MHLINIPNQERETEAIIRLLDTDPLIEPLFRDLGLTWPLCWCVVQLDQKKLVSTRFGDVDILAGNLNWNDTEQFFAHVREERTARPDWHPSWHADFAARRLASEDGILWPPSIDPVVAIEVKCAYFLDTIRAAKGGKRDEIRKQVTGLQKNGV